jgi:hypothetical protein
MGSAQHRSHKFEKAGCGKQFDANHPRQSLELGVERGVVNDCPFRKK